MVNEEKEQIQEPELKTYYVLKLLSSGINKITLLKEIRKIKNCDLQTGKDIVDTPNSIIAYSEEQDTANEWKLVLKETGASIEIGIIQSSMPLMESSKLLEVSKSRNDSKTEEKSFITTLLLAVFFGWLGAHRFYTGYTGIGILQFCSFGGWGIWILIDLFSICTNNYKDINGNTLKGYNGILNIIPLLKQLRLCTLKKRLTYKNRKITRSVTANLRKIHDSKRGNLVTNQVVRKKSYQYRWKKR